MFQNKISSFYKALLPALVREIAPPEERFADCDNCHHCQSPKNFRYETKCCDYHPKLPNYMVGAILSDEDETLSEGRNRVLAKITAKKGVTPYGIIAPMEFHKAFQANRQKRKHAPQTELTNLKCPYLATDKSCTIYKYRSDICPVFYCMSSSGKAGSRFWNTAFEYMTSVERKLSLYALQQLGYPVLQTNTGQIGPAFFQLEDEAGILNDKTYQHIWKDWSGKEIAFYKACFQAIQTLSAPEVAHLLGIETEIMSQKMQQLAQKMQKINIPDFMQLDKAHQLFVPLEKGETITFSNGKNLKMTRLQVMMLRSFNGTTTTLSVVQKANLMKTNINGLLAPLLEEGILKRV